eukprot:jgi/Chrzof1/12154/Cz06g23040.t1
MLFGGGLIKPGPAAVKQYLGTLDQADGVLHEVYQAKLHLLDAQAELRDAKVWFWWADKAKTQLVKAKQAEVAAQRRDFNKVIAERDKLLSRAKSSLGLWSDIGVQESKALFWESFESGRMFAKQQSVIDVILRLLYGREEELVGKVSETLLVVFVNFMSGLSLSVFIFLFRLPWMIATFQPNLASGFAFWLLSALGAISVVLSYLGLLLAGSAGVVYAITVPLNRRIEGGRGHIPPRPIRYHGD